VVESQWHIACCSSQSWRFAQQSIGEESLTDLAFGALVIAAAAWTLGNTGIAQRARSLATFIFIFFLSIAAILFAFAVLGVSLP
jgi:hypothetical protein